MTIKKISALVTLVVALTMIIMPAVTLISGGSLEEANKTVSSRIHQVTHNFLEATYHLSNMVSKGIDP